MTPTLRWCSRSSRCSGRARWKQPKSPAPCACRTRPARNIWNSTPSCSALAVAKDVGMDMGRLEKDMASPEVKAALDEDFKLAEALGLNGTPSYVIGSDVVVGAIGLPGLQEKVNTARCGKPTCS